MSDTAEKDATTKARLARLTLAVYDPADWSDLHLVADGDCVERCPACVANDLYAALRSVFPPGKSAEADQ